MKKPITIALATLLSLCVIATPCLADSGSLPVKQTCSANSHCSNEQAAAAASKAQDKELAMVSSGFLALLIALSGAGTEAK